MASAVNDITREVGGVLGIAVLSSILIGFYRTEIEPATAGLPDPIKDLVNAGAGAGATIGLADEIGPQGEALATAAREAFAVGLSASMWVGAVVLAVAALITLIVAPGRSTVSRSGHCWKSTPMKTRGFPRVLGDLRGSRSF